MKSKRKKENYFLELAAIVIDRFKVTIQLANEQYVCVCKGVQQRR